MEWTLWILWTWVDGEVEGKWNLRHAMGIHFTRKRCMIAPIALEKCGTLSGYEHRVPLVWISRQGKAADRVEVVSLDSSQSSS